MKGLEGEKMKITVKSCVNRYELYTEPDNRLISQLRKKRCGGKKLDILDAEGNLAASTRKKKRFSSQAETAGRFPAGCCTKKTAAGTKFPALWSVLPCRNGFS